MTAFLLAIMKNNFSPFNVFFLRFRNSFSQKSKYIGIQPALVQTFSIAKQQCHGVLVRTWPRKFSTYVRVYTIASVRAGVVAHPVTQVIGEQAIVDILDLSEAAWTCWGYFYTQ